jgi:hypothetical protein
MTNGQMLLIAAISATSALSGFTLAAQFRGWPQGSIFTKAWPTTMGAFLMVALFANVVVSAAATDLSWLWVVWSLLSVFIGGPVVYLAFGANSGPISLVAAPALTFVLLFYFKL